MSWRAQIRSQNRVVLVCQKPVKQALLNSRINTMKELTFEQVEEVSGGVSQDLAIGGNLSIVGIGVGIAVAGSAPAWFPIAMIGVSIGLTASYLYKVLGR